MKITEFDNNITCTDKNIRNITIDILEIRRDVCLDLHFLFGFIIYSHGYNSTRYLADEGALGEHHYLDLARRK